MYKAKLISADFEKSTIGLKVDDGFTIETNSNNYIIMSEAEFEEISNAANGVVDNIDKLKKELLDTSKIELIHPKPKIGLTLEEFPTAYDIWNVARTDDLDVFIKWLNSKRK